MQLYHYDDQGALTHTTTARMSPREPGVPLIPRNATTVAPPEASEGTVPVFARGAWTLQADNRGRRWYHADGREGVIARAGDTPPSGAGFTRPAALVLAEARSAKLRELAGAFEAANRAPLASSALGREHLYDAEPHNEANLVGLLAAEVESAAYTCDDRSGGADAKRQRTHTLAELRQIAVDAAARRQALIARLRAKRAAALAAEDAAAVAAVTFAD